VIARDCSGSYRADRDRQSFPPKFSLGGRFASSLEKMPPDVVRIFKEEREKLKMVQKKIHDIPHIRLQRSAVIGKIARFPLKR